MADGVPWSIERGAQASEIAGIEIRVFGAVYSAAFGTVVWSSVLPSLQALEEAGDKLAASSAFSEAIAKGANLFDGPVEDTLLQLVHGAPNPDEQPAYVTSVRAICANGQLARGLTTGVEIAQRAEKVTGLPTIFATEASGTFGGVAWLTGFESIAALEAANDALTSDSGWLDYLDKEGGKAYVDGVQQTIFRRLG